MRKLALILLLLAVAIPVAATDLDDLNTSLPSDSYDVSTHALYLRTLHLAVRTFGLSEHDGAGLHMIPMGTKPEMLASTEVNGRLFFVTDPPARMHIYRSSCDCWSPVAVYNPDELDFFMYVSDYDPNDYGDRVEYAEGLYDGTDTVSATDVYAHTQMTDGTDNPHGLEADDIDFTSGTEVIEDLVTATAGNGAALIPLEDTGSFVSEIVSSASGDGAALIPFTTVAASLSGASSLDVFDMVDEGYDVTLLLDDLILDAGPWVDVRFYGGTGDDTTDDSTAFQSAVDEVSAGTFILIPAGDFYISTAVEIETAGVWLVGAGIDRTTIHRNDAVGAAWGALCFNKDDVSSIEGMGLANLTVTSEAMATTAVGVTVGNATTGAKVTFENVKIDGGDFLSTGIDLLYAYDSTFRDLEVLDCGVGIKLADNSGNNQANRNLHFDKGKVTGCTAVGATDGAIAIEWGENLTFRDYNLVTNEGRAVDVYLNSGAHTRAVLFDGCAFKENLSGALTSKYQVALTAAGALPYAKWTFQSCSFVDSVNGSNTNKHLAVANKMQLFVRGCYFDEPGPDESFLRVVGDIGADCQFFIDEYNREGWAIDTTAHVKGAGVGHMVNGYGRSESLVRTLASGTPSAIDGVVGDRVLTTGGNVGKGDPGGWVCTESGSFDTPFDTGANCTTTATSPTFTVSASHLSGHMIEIGERLAFTSDSVWSVTYPTVIGVSIDGTIVSVTMNSNAGDSTATDTATKQEPEWTPIAEIPLYKTESAVTVGAVLAGALVSGTFTVTGAAEGDFVTGAIEWSALGEADPEDFLITWNAGTNTVRYVIYNGSGADITTEVPVLDGADFYVVVRKRGATVP